MVPAPLHSAPPSAPPAPARPSRLSRHLLPLCLLLGALPILPLALNRSPVLNNDMLVAYFSYFWDFHGNFSWKSPLAFWSSSFQCGMPMHAYWQSGYLYPLTWLFFGPISPHYGIYLFYAFHFALAIYGFARMAESLGLILPAALWGGLCFGLSGTLLARYEHATFLAGWAWMPMVVYALLQLARNPGRRSLFLYAGAVALQCFGGHPQASLVTAMLVIALLGFFFFSRLSRRGTAFLLLGQALALIWCSPLLVPLADMLGEVQRYDGVEWEQSGEGNPVVSGAGGVSGGTSSGAFRFEKFSTGGMRPMHLISLALPHALGSPSNASWWGGEVWGEVFVYAGALGLFFCAFASPRRLPRISKWLLLCGLAGLWLAFGANLGASQVLYHVPGFNQFRRPARYVALFVLAMALLSAHGFQRFLGRPRGRRTALLMAGGGGLMAAAFALMRAYPDPLVTAVESLRGALQLDAEKDYSAKLIALAGRLAQDGLVVLLSALSLLFYLAGPGKREADGKNIPAVGVFGGFGRRLFPRAVFRTARPRIAILFAALVLDLTRLHWDHFYLFPADFYRERPGTEAYFDISTRVFWRVGHYLEYPGLELWHMHNGPLRHWELFEREKLALSCGIHAVFGYDHYHAHLPFLWRWREEPGLGQKSTRYLMSNVPLGEGHTLLGQVDSVRVYEVRDWRPRLELLRPRRPDAPRQDLPRAGPGDGIRAGRPGPEAPKAVSSRREGPDTCPPGYSGFGGLCAWEKGDGHIVLRASLAPGDTLLLRERHHPGWRYRGPDAIWRRPARTKQDFLAAPIPEKWDSLEWRFFPFRFYQALGASLMAAIFLALAPQLSRKSS